MIPHQSIGSLFPTIDSTMTIRTDKAATQSARRLTSFDNVLKVVPTPMPQPIHRRARSLPGQLCDEESGRPLFWFLPCGDTAGHCKIRKATKKKTMTASRLQPREFVNEQKPRSSKLSLTAQQLRDLVFLDLLETERSETCDVIQVHTINNDGDDSWTAYSTDSEDDMSISSELLGLEFAPDWLFFDSSNALVGLELLVEDS
jgi:hypothetical protein